MLWWGLRDGRVFGWIGVWVIGPAVNLTARIVEFAKDVYKRVAVFDGFQL